MKNNDIICYICNKKITKKQLQEAILNKDITGKIQYRHNKKVKFCTIKTFLKPVIRKSNILNKRQWIKKSDKIYNRKIKYKKELENG